jgi:hypothetical protein
MSSRVFRINGNPLRVGDRVSAWFEDDVNNGEVENEPVLKMYWRKSGLWIVTPSCRFTADCIEEHFPSSTDPGGTR